MSIGAKPIRILEITGPAGAGKSSLAQALAQHPGVKRISAPPYYRRPADFLFFARNTAEVFPTLLKFASHRNGQGVSLNDAAWVVTLHGWHRVLARAAGADARLVLDEGPIFHMAFLQIYGSKTMTSPITQAWWDGMCAKWAGFVDVAVYLDAPDEVLINRIRARDKAHGVKVKPDDYAYQYLATLREKYEDLFCKLTSKEPKLRIVRYNTLQTPIQQIVSEITALY